MNEKTPGQADEPAVHLVQLWLCDPCLDGQGDECHTPGCALWLNRVPDMPIRDHATAVAGREQQPAHEQPADVGTAWRLLDETRERLSDTIDHYETLIRALKDDFDKVAADLAALRLAVAALEGDVRESADASRPSRKSEIEDEFAARLRQILEET